MNYQRFKSKEKDPFPKFPDFDLPFKTHFTKPSDFKQANFDFAGNSYKSIGAFKEDKPEPKSKFSRLESEFKLEYTKSTALAKNDYNSPVRFDKFSSKSISKGSLQVFYKQLGKYTIGSPELSNKFVSKKQRPILGDRFGLENVIKPKPFQTLLQQKPLTKAYSANKFIQSDFETSFKRTFDSQFKIKSKGSYLSPDIYQPKLKVYKDQLISRQKKTMSQFAKLDNFNFQVQRPKKTSLKLEDFKFEPSKYSGRGREFSPYPQKENIKKPIFKFDSKQTKPKQKFNFQDLIPKSKFQFEAVNADIKRQRLFTADRKIEQAIKSTTATSQLNPSLLTNNFKRPVDSPAITQKYSPNSLFGKINSKQDQTDDGFSKFGSLFEGINKQDPFSVKPRHQRQQSQSNWAQRVDTLKRQIQVTKHKPKAKQVISDNNFGRFKEDSIVQKYKQQSDWPSIQESRSYKPGNGSGKIKQLEADQFVYGGKRFQLNSQAEDSLLERLGRHPPMPAFEGQNDLLRKYSFLQEDRKARQPRVSEVGDQLEQISRRIEAGYSSYKSKIQ